jgi:hypothetical protein
VSSSIARVRVASAAIASCASMRARWAPRQRCTPPPNAR